MKYTTMKNKNFCAFILSHGRANNVKTYETLRRQGYTGDIYIVVDDEDKSIEEYRRGVEQLFRQDRAAGHRHHRADAGGGVAAGEKDRPPSAGRNGGGAYSGRRHRQRH